MFTTSRWLYVYLGLTFIGFITTENIICPDPGVSKDGDRKGSCCSSGDVLQFSCNVDYELVGSETIECLSTGSWNSTRPLCKPVGIHCEPPPVIRHGLFTELKAGDYFRPYDELEIACEPGYSYKGPAQYVMCESEGVWDDEFGECEEIFCDPPQLLDNGAIPEVMATNLASFHYSFEITYVCNKGRRLVGGDSWSFCSKGKWSGQMPNCEEIRCPDPGTPEHGWRVGHNFEVGAKVNFSCFPGYNLLGSRERYCMPNGQWSGELARCDIKSNYCPNPGIPINGIKNTTHYDLGVRVGFLCRSGYILVGSKVRQCLSNKTWSGKETRCLGLYDYDNAIQIRDFLKIAIDKKAKEQEKEIQNYLEANSAHLYSGPVGGIVDLSYPGRIMLYFLFDASGSIGAKNFNKSIDFAKAIVKKIGITKNGARTGAIAFSSEGAIDLELPLHESTEDALNAFDTIKHTGGETPAISPLHLVRTEFMPLIEKRLGRKSVKTVMFILTNGRMDMNGDFQEEAKVLKDSGMEIYCIGITGNDRRKALYSVASEPTNEHVFILDNYSTLAWLAQEINSVNNA